MRTRVILIVLVLSLLLGLTACGGKENPAGTLPPEGLIPGADTVPESTEAPAPALPQPKGADSVKALLGLSLDYFHSGSDYSKIEEYHDPLAYLAYFMIEDFYEDEDLNLAQAMERPR